MAKFQVWKSTKDVKHYWRLKCEGNGEIICWAEGYSSKQAAVDSINWVKRYASGASVEEI
jgi:uncharacterized protein YegP (UPF0339 family)